MRRSGKTLQEEEMVQLKAKRAGFCEATEKDQDSKGTGHAGGEIIPPCQPC